LTGYQFGCSVYAVNPDSPESRRRVTAAGELREALSEHGQAVKRAWAADVSTVPLGSRDRSVKSRSVIRIDLDEDEARALARLIRAAARCPGGDPGQVGSAPPALLTVKKVARLTGHPESTIRAWLCLKNRPKRNPFPRPVPRSSGEPTRFDQLEVEAWIAREPPARQRPPIAEDPPPP
jgi:predicted DNA-binding transcriptional regulator AlpA